MPSTKKKAPATTSSITTTPTNIKTEPHDRDVFPLSHFVDDPVELIRQAFSSLKAKTIKSIAPDFLQKCTVESIQEYCLDELLGISKKRLLSIINATKCPTDTEDSSSDVEKIEEHISLEEISSDSADEKLSSRRRKKLNKTKSKTTTVENPDGGGGVKKMSVLELLELQARARAIRSQLALEPVTKIELDSDGVEHSTTDADSVKKSSNKKVTAAATTKNGSAATTKAAAATSVPVVAAAAKAKEPEIRPVRLKRNFRQRQCSDYEGDESETVVVAAATAPAEEPKKSVATESSSQPAVAAAQLQQNDTSSSSEKKASSDVDARMSSRSPSPDIVTIVHMPETLCISSESENEDEQFLQRIKSKNNYIQMPPPVQRENRPETADEQFLRRVREEGGGGSGGGAKTVTMTNNSLVISVPVPMVEEKPVVVQPMVEVDNEPEEGELTDDEEMVVEPIVIVADDDEATPAAVEKIVSDVAVTQTCDESPVAEESSTVVLESSSSSGSDSEDSDSESEAEAETKPIVSVPTTNVVDGEQVEIDDDDDIIDLGKDEDFELKDDDETSPLKKSKLDASSTVDESETSWGTRWLSSKKVTKVMTTSKLANKVRNKIKQSKKTRAAAEAQAAVDKLEQAKADDLAKVAAAAAVVANSDMGSVQQYKDIVAATTITTTTTASVNE